MQFLFLELLTISGLFLEHFLQFENIVLKKWVHLTEEFQFSIDHNDIVAPGDSGVCFLGSRWLSTGSSLIFPSLSSVTKWVLSFSHIIINLKECCTSTVVTHIVLTWLHSNYMVRIGYYGKQTAGVFVSNSDRILVSNNLIHDIPRGKFHSNCFLWNCLKT